MNFGAPWDSLKSSVPQVPDALLHILKSRFSFTNMTPVQECAIPLLCQHKDIAAQAETGSGKTFAYLVPIVVSLIEKIPHLLDVANGSPNESGPQLGYIHALIVAPTQVLAQQIYDVLIQVVARHYVLLLIGGTDAPTDQASGTLLDRPLVVATPGRLRYYLADGLVSLKDLEILILDEADQVIVSKDFPYIRAKLPSQRRTGLFSATFDSVTEADLALLMRNPHVVKLYNAAKEQDMYIVPQNLVMWYKVVPYEQKLYMLLRHINALRSQHKVDSPKKLIVFFMTCSMSQYMSFAFTHIFELLPGQQVGVYCFNGKQSQETKIKNYNSFLSDTRFSVLFTTDISARGLDISDVSHVLQFDPPKLIATYTHRAGRTARCYRSGDAGIFLGLEEVGIVSLLRTRGIPLRELTVEQDAQLFDASATKASDCEFTNFIASPPSSSDLESTLTTEELSALQASIKELTQKTKKLMRALATNQQRASLAAESTDSTTTAVQKMQSVIRNTIELPLNETRERLTALLEQEKSYLEQRNYMYNHDLTKFLRRLQSEKREIFESCQRALETWLSGYNENEAKLIFNVEKLPLGEFAVSLGLLKLPNHNLLRRKHINFKSVDIDVSKIVYSNPKREESRQIQLDISTKKKEAREQMRQERERLRHKGESNEITEAIRTSLTQQALSHGHRVPTQFSGEARLLSLLKSGKITEDEFDNMVDDLALSSGKMSKNPAKIRKWRR
ncbi:ATP-dependent RNA helicase [Giardia lamblia P15]|uniref:ATP-dependent RNA helicase n=1 Tax=Giardia intestinalis (strain P15) TaxID=658858 RepID=E1F0T1_GIAIA|nr:ATP-dependent RNA helicase [Giardia lamblia P15]